MNRFGRAQALPLSYPFPFPDSPGRFGSAVSLYVNYPFAFVAPVVLERLGIDIAGSWLHGTWPRLWGHVDGCLFFCGCGFRGIGIWEGLGRTGVSCSGIILGSFLLLSMLCYFECKVTRLQVDDQDKHPF